MHRGDSDQGHGCGVRAVGGDSTSGVRGSVAVEWGGQAEKRDKESAFPPETLKLGADG